MSRTSLSLVLDLALNALAFALIALAVIIRTVR